MQLTHLQIILRLVLCGVLVVAGNNLSGQCALSVQDINICSGGQAMLGLNVQLTIAGVPSNALISNYTWKQGSNEISTNATHLVSPASTTTYTLTVQAAGCGSVSDNFTVNVVPSGCPNAAFSSSPSPVCSGAQLNFSNQTTPSVGTTYTWFFNGTTSNQRTPSHIFNAPEGTGIQSYPVTLVAVNNGFMSVEQHDVQVQQIPSKPTVTSSQLTTYNGEQLIYRCVSTGTTGTIFISQIISNGSGWVQNTTIDWGDGSPVVDVTTSTVNHIYSMGLYSLKLTEYGPNACQVSNTYPVFVGNTPQVSVPLNTDLDTLCAPFTVNLPISNVSGNIAGTTYTVVYSDGSATETYNHPPPPFITHTFTESSCGFTASVGTNTYADAYSIQVTAQNVCGNNIGISAPYRIASAPVSDFLLSANPLCITAPLDISSTADPGNNIGPQGCNQDHGQVWTITPSTGWTLQAGSLGTLNGQPNNFQAWVSGSDALKIKFSSPGNYTISQRIRNSCGEDVSTKTVCVVPPLTAKFHLQYSDQCAPEILTTDNLTQPVNTCVPPVYLWSISPAAIFNPPGTPASFEPSFTLTDDGTYTITLSATNACGTFTDDTVFTIVAPPSVTLLPIPPGCSPYTVNPSVSYDDGGGSITLQEWKIDNGPWTTVNPSEPVVHAPITFTTGSHTISVRLTNQCGTTTSTQTVVVSVPPQINIPDFSLCSGVTDSINGNISPVVPGTGAPPYIYSWTGPGINNRIVSNPEISLINNSVPPLPLSQIISLTVTDATGCSVTKNITVTVNPLPTLTAAPNKICIGAAAVPLSVNSTIQGTTFTWSPDTSLNTGTGASVLASPSSTTQYSITGVVAATGCISSTQTILTVNPLPLVDAGPPLLVCIQPSAIQLSTGTPGGGIWSDPTPLTGTLAQPNFYTPPLIPGNDTLIYSYTDINGCTNSDSILLTIVAPQTAAAGSDFQVCENGGVLLINPGSPAGGTWSGPGVTLQGTDFFFDPAIAGPGSHTLSYSIYAGTTCANTDQLVVTVFPAPVANAGIDRQICSGDTTRLTALASGGTPPFQYQWQAPAGVIGAVNTNEITVSHLNAGAIAQNYTYTVSITDAKNCKAADLVNLVVNPLPLVNAGADLTVCAQPIPFTLTNFSPVAGGTGTWSGSTNLSGNTYTPFTTPGQETLIYTFTDLNGCVAYDQLIVRRNPPVFPNAGADFSSCKNATPVTLTPLTNPGGNWSGNGVSNGIFNPSVASTGVHLIIYTINSGTTCQTSDSIRVTVFNIPIVNAGNDKTICSGDTITFTATNSSGLPPYNYLWSPTQTIISGGDSTSVKVSGKNTSLGIATVTYTIEVSDANNCSVSDQVNLIIRPNPLVNAGRDTSICFSNVATYRLQNFSPSGGSWTNFPGNVGSLNGLEFQTGGIGPDSLRYSFTDAFGCSAADTIVITVTSPATVDAGQDLSFCISDPAIVLPMPQPANPPVNYSASWVGTGIVNSGNVYSFNPATAGSGTFTLRYNYQFGANCTATDIISVYVGSIPQVNASDLEICHGETENLNVTLQANSGTAPFTYQWQPAGNLSNIYILSPDYTANNTGNTPLAETLELTLKDKAGCSINKQIVITVNPLPVVYAGEDVTLCNQPISHTLTGYNPLSGGTGIWSGSSNLSGPIFTPAGTGTQTLTYTFTDLNGCENSDAMQVSVVPPVFPEAGPNDFFCLNDIPVTLTSVTQPGGRWAGTGVSANGTEFNPTSAGVGTHSIRYTIYAGTTCETFDTKTFRVFPMPLANAGTDEEVCSGNSLKLNAQVAAGTSPYQLSWSPSIGITSGANSFSPQITLTNNTANDSTHRYTFIVTDSAGCVSTDQVNILVHPLPVVNAGPDIILCNQAIAHTLSGYSPVSGGNGVWSGSSHLSGIIYTPSGTGTQTLIYTFTDLNGCVNSDQTNVTTVEPIFPNAGTDKLACISDTAFVLISLTQPGGKWSGAGVIQNASDYYFSPSNSGAGNLVLTYTIHEGTTCETRDQLSITVNDLPVVRLGPDLSTCIDTTCVQISDFSPNNGAGIIPATAYFLGEGQISSNGLICPASNLPGDYSIYYQYTEPTTGCSNLDSMIFRVHPLPVANFAIDSVFCINTSREALNLSRGDTLYGGGFSSEWMVSHSQGANIFTSTDANPEIIFADTGTYTVRLSVKSDVGCRNQYTMPLIAVERPNPSFTLSESSGCVPMQVQIENTSEGYLPEYNWSVEGVYMDSSNYPAAILFPSPILGDTIYTVKLSIENLCGTREQEIDFAARPTPVSVPVANQLSGCSPFIPVFSNLSYGAPESFKWILSDGTEYVDTLPEAHPFIAIDNDTTYYTVTLISTNGCGSDSSTLHITALPNTVVAFFNTDPPFGCADLQVGFTNFSAGADSFRWSFGDGSPEETTVNANHVYRSGGIFSVRLISTDGCSSDTAFSTVRVLQKPTVDFVPDENVICQGSELSLTNLSSGAVAFQWNFGDSTTSTSFEPVHIFDDAGQYNIRLVGYSPVYGCPDTLVRQVRVLEIPKIQLAVHPMTGCSPLHVKFENNSQHCTGADWVFGNGSTSNEMNPQTDYLTPGDYSAQVTFHNASTIFNLNCPVDTQVTISVFPTPLSDFSLNSTSSCGNTASVTVSNSSESDLYYHWQWQSFHSFEFEPLIEITDTGLIKINLIVSNQYACADTSFANYDLVGQPDPGLLISPPFGCEDLDVHFTSTTAYGDSWTWDFGDGTTSSEGRDIHHTYKNKGYYEVKLNVSNKNMCFADTVVAKTIVVYPRAHAGLTIEPDEISEDYPIVTFENGSTGATSYLFSMGDGAVYNGFINQHIYHPLEEASFTITFIANNNFNCPDTVVKFLSVLPSARYYIPNSFTPNGDGKNDLFGPAVYAETSSYEFLVFNRWGEQIFHSIDKNVKWDGTYKNDLVQSDVYVYKIVIVFENGAPAEPIIGRVALIY